MKNPFEVFWAKTWQPTQQPAVFDQAMKELAEKAYNAALADVQAKCIEVCEQIAIKHQQTDTTYAAGKKAGALECAEALQQQLFK